jgi:hypothetical protein
MEISVSGIADRARLVVESIKESFLYRAIISNAKSGSQIGKTQKTQKQKNGRKPKKTQHMIKMH